MDGLEILSVLMRPEPGRSQEMAVAESAPAQLQELLRLRARAAIEGAKQRNVERENRRLSDDYVGLVLRRAISRLELEVRGKSATGRRRERKKDRGAHARERAGSGYVEVPGGGQLLMRLLGGEETPQEELRLDALVRPERAWKAPQEKPRQGWEKAQERRAQGRLEIRRRAAELRAAARTQARPEAPEAPKEEEDLLDLEFDALLPSLDLEGLESPRESPTGSPESRGSRSDREPRTFGAQAVPPMLSAIWGAPKPGPTAAAWGPFGALPSVDAPAPQAASSAQPGSTAERGSRGRRGRNRDRRPEETEVPRERGRADVASGPQTARARLRTGVAAPVSDKSHGGGGGRHGNADRASASHRAGAGSALNSCADLPEMFRETAAPRGELPEFFRDSSAPPFLDFVLEGTEAPPKKQRSIEPFVANGWQ